MLTGKEIYLSQASNFAVKRPIQCYEIVKQQEESCILERKVQVLSALRKVHCTSLYLYDSKMCIVRHCVYPLQLTDELKVDDGFIFLTKGSFQPYNGNLLVYKNKTWWRIDSQDWDMEDARVACRQIGFAGILEQLTHFDDNISLPCLGNLKCLGNESHLLNCSHEIVSTPECYGVGISCRE